MDKRLPTVLSTARRVLSVGFPDGESERYKASRDIRRRAHGRHAALQFQRRDAKWMRASFETTQANTNACLGRLVPDRVQPCSLRRDRYAAFFRGTISRFAALAHSRSAISKSYCACRVIQSWGSTVKKRPRRRAVSAVTALFPEQISSIRRWGTPIAFATR